MKTLNKFIIFFLTLCASYSVADPEEIKKANANLLFYSYSWMANTSSLAEALEGIKKALANGANIDTTYFKNGIDTELSIDSEMALKYKKALKAFKIIERLSEETFKNMTPLMFTVLYDNNLSKYLIEKGANLEATTLDGKTPLMWAAESGSIFMVKYLKAKGADYDAKSHKGETALSLAKKNKHQYTRNSTVEFLSFFKLMSAIENGDLKTVQSVSQDITDIDTNEMKIYLDKNMFKAHRLSEDFFIKASFTPLSSVTPLEWAIEHRQEGIAQFLRATRCQRAFDAGSK